MNHFFKGISLILLALFSSHLGYGQNSKTDQLVTISTEFGDMKLILFDETPQHKANFLKQRHNLSSHHRWVYDTGRRREQQRQQPE